MPSRDSSDILSLMTKMREARFWASVDVRADGECWLWKGWRLNSGYGETTIQARKITVHRLAYTLAYGPIPAGMLVLHRCDNPLCVNPSHLWIGTDADNMADKAAKDRQVRGMRQWSAKLTEENVLELRKLRREDPKKWTAKTLGARYGVSGAAAVCVWTRRTWTHLP